MYVPRRTNLTDAAKQAGVQVDDLTASDAFALTGLDWQVELHPTVAVVGDKVLPVGNRRAAVRVEAGAEPVLLGTVGQQFTPYQNRDAWDATVEVMHGEGWQTGITGLFGDGQRVFMQFRTPDVFRATGEERERFVTFTNFHDGTGSGGWNWGSVLIVCANTFMANVAQESDAIRFQHVRSGVPSPAVVREALGLAVAADVEFEAMVAELLTVKVSDKRLLDVADSVLGGKPQLRDFADAKRSIEAQDNAYVRARSQYVDRNATLIGIFGGPTVNFGGTGWGALNALSEWQEHYAPGGDKVRAKHVLSGDTVGVLRDAARELVRS